MTAPEADPNASEPDPSERTQGNWYVQSVFDPDGGGSDFAYTVGLSTHGLPELHLWARPTEGDDPGADWILSPHDRRVLLSEFAHLALQGKVAVGSEITRDADGGLATMRFRFDPPVEPGTVDAFGVADGASVVPIRWSLTREPEGELGPADLDRIPTALRGRYDLGFGTELWHGLHHELRRAGDELPEVWRPDDPPGYGPDQWFGPLTPMVRAAGAEFFNASAADLVRFTRNIWRALTAELTPACFLGAVHGAARVCGRTVVLDRIGSVADELADSLLARASRLPYWIDERDKLAVWSGMGTAENPDFPTVVRDLTRSWVNGHLATVAVLDVMGRVDPIARDAMLGPWLFTRSWDEYTAPLDLFQAPDEVVEQVAALLGRIGGPERLFLDRLKMLSDAAEPAIAGFSPYQGVFEKMLGLGTVTAALSPTVDDVLTRAGHPFALETLAKRDVEDRDFLDSRIDDPEEAEYLAEEARDDAEFHAEENRRHGLGLVLSVLMTAIVHRERLQAEDLTALEAFYEPYLPGSAPLFTPSRGSMSHRYE